MRKTLPRLCVLVSMVATAALGQSESEPKVHLQGYVDDPQRGALFQDLFSELVHGRFHADSPANLADVLLVYSGPEIIQSGRFVPPLTATIPGQQIQILESQVFEDGKCEVYIWQFTRTDQTAVVVIDDTDPFIPEVTEACVLLAIATALGADYEASRSLRIFELVRIIDDLTTEDSIDE